MAERIIYHVDVNSAFLSWSAVERLREDPTSVDLRTIPSAVCGDKESRHGIITAKSIPSKKYHIETGEPVVKALEKCPDLVMVEGHYHVYSEYSRALMDLLRKYAPVVDQYSIDEAFCDMTGTRSLYGDPIEFAYKLKDEIYETLGFSVNVGISSNKLLAKMASDFEKPNKVHTLFPEEVPEKMWPLPVGDLFLVGKSTGESLRQIGIKTIFELAHTDEDLLVSRFKSFGHTLYEYANGRDGSEKGKDSMGHSHDVANKSFSNEITISHDITDREEARLVILSLAETLGSRLRNSHFRVSVIAAYFKDSDFKTHSKQLTIDHNTDSTDELYENGMKLFDMLWHGEPIRLIGLSGAKAEEEGTPEQMSLFGNEERERREKLDRAIDIVRGKYGSSAIKRASLMADKDRKRVPRPGDKH